MKFKSTILSITICMAALASLTISAFAADEEATPSQDVYKLKTITYNVCGLPEMITYDRNLAPMDKRFTYIGKKLNSYDLIGLQEAFVTKRRIIEDELGGYYLARGTDVGMSGKIGSGVYTFSKYPIKRIHYERWRKTTGPDALSHKGFVLTTIEVSDDLWIDVYNLHAQAGGSKERIDIDNMYQLAEAMKALSFGNGRPIILIGDFNCRFWDEQCSLIPETMGMTPVVPEQDGVDHMFFNENDSPWTISVEGFKDEFTEKLKGKLPSDHIAKEATYILTRKSAE